MCICCVYLLISTCGLCLFLVGVRDLPERDIWSLCVGRGGGWEIHVSSVAVVAAPGLDPKNVVLVVIVFFTIGS